jgi:hypothetical protein
MTFQANGNLNEQEYVYLYLKKVKFQTKIKKRQRRSLCNDQGINSTIRYNDDKSTTPNIGIPNFIK